MKALKFVPERRAEFHYYSVRLYQDEGNGMAILEIISKICPQLHIKYRLRCDHPNFDYFSNSIFEMILECREENDILEISAQDRKILRLPVNFINEMAEAINKCLSFSPQKSIIRYAVDLCYPNSAASADIDCEYSSNRSILTSVPVSYRDAEYIAKWANYLIDGPFDFTVLEGIIKEIESASKSLFLRN